MGQLRSRSGGRLGLVLAPIAAAVGVYALPPGSADPASCRAPLTTTTGNFSERALSVDAGSGTPVAVYSERVDGLHAGDTLAAFAEGELTNDLGTPVAVEAWLVLASSPTGTTGTRLTGAGRTLVTPAMHHFDLREAGALTLRRDLERGYVNLVVRASGASRSPAQLRVEQDYGRLSVLRFRQDGEWQATAGVQRATRVDVAAHRKIVLYSAPLDGVREGDVLVGLAELGVRADAFSHVAVEADLVLAEGPLDTSGIAIGARNDVELIADAGDVALMKSGTVAVPSVVRAGYVNLVLRARGGKKARKATVYVASGGAGLSVLRIPPAAACFTYRSTAHRSELAASLDVFARTPTVVYSQRFEHLRRGDVLAVLADARAVGPRRYNVGVVTSVVLAESPHSTTGLEISEANGRNSTPSTPVVVPTKMGAVELPRDFGTAYVNLVMKAASTAAVPGDAVAITPGGGQLTVLHFRS